MAIMKSHFLKINKLIIEKMLKMWERNSIDFFFISFHLLTAADKKNQSNFDMINIALAVKIQITYYLYGNPVISSSKDTLLYLKTDYLLFPFHKRL